MNLAFSILSAASATAEAAATEAAAAAEELGVVDRLQAYTATAEQSIAQQQLADPDYWGSVGIITVAGLLMVFVILALLIFIFWGMGQFFMALDKKKAAKLEAEKAAKAAEAAKQAEAAPAEEITEEDISDDDEIIAVISAAIAAYSEQDGKQYEIRSIRRKDSRTRSAWSLAGIGENTRPF